MCLLGGAQFPNGKCIEYLWNASIAILAKCAGHNVVLDGKIHEYQLLHSFIVSYAFYWIRITSAWMYTTNSSDHVIRNNQL